MNKKKSNKSEEDTKRVKEYFCKICDLKCRTKFNYNRHLSTHKHIKKNSEKKQKYVCNQFFMGYFWQIYDMYRKRNI